MGTECDGTLTVGGQKVNVRADFASDHVTFSGGRRGEVPYSAIEVVGTARGVLRLRVDGSPMEFPLGNAAERVANKIRKPPALADKLGVKPGLKVAAVDVPRDLLKALKEAAGQVADSPPAAGADLVFVGVSDVEGLEALEGLSQRLTPTGHLWVVYPKARNDIRETHVREAGRALGLVDTKVARVSATHTALRFSHSRT